MIVLSVVRQHVEDAVLQAMSRAGMTQWSTAGLGRLRRFDGRLKANLDGLRIAGEAGWELCEATLAGPAQGGLFVVAVRALEEQDEKRLDRAIRVGQVLDESGESVAASFEWADRGQLQGIVANLLRSSDGYEQMVGLAACAAHRVDPGITTKRFLEDDRPVVRGRALRAAGELGTADAMVACLTAVRGDDQQETRFWASWSSVLLGDRGRGLEVLVNYGLSESRRRVRAFRLALQAMSDDACDSVLRQLARDPTQLRWAIRGSGLAGSPRYVLWLVKHMTDPRTARLAGEAFELITGASLATDALDCPAPADFESGPTDDPDDPNVAMDPDDGLSWPDVRRVEKWWSANAHRFKVGQRYFVGRPVTREHCIDVLKNGCQRQRILAAHYLCLLSPGTPLFNTSAPAWRQRRLLANMT